MRIAWHHVYKLIVVVALVCFPNARASNDWLVRVMYPPAWCAQSTLVIFSCRSVFVSLGRWSQVCRLLAWHGVKYAVTRMWETGLFRARQGLLGLNVLVLV